MPDDEPPPAPEPELEQEQADLSIEARITAIESQLAQLNADFSNHEHVEYAPAEHGHDSGEPGTPPPAPDEQPKSGHWWFKRIGD